LIVENIHALEKILLVLVLVLAIEESVKIEDEQENEDEEEWEDKNREPLRQSAEPVRVARLAFIFSFAASQGCVKGTNFQFNSRRPGDFYASWSGA
jgi:hypothetical protein